MKKFVSLMMSFVMLLSVTAGMNLTVFAADESSTSGKCGDNASWNYDVSTQTLTISGTGDMYNYGQFFNEETCEMERRKTPWNSYASSRDDKAIKKVVIQDGITSIGNEAFEYCYSLNSVSMPNSITKIGKLAFFACSKLSEVNLSNNLKEIKPMAFESCNLSNVFIPGSVEKIGEDDYQNDVFSSDRLENIYVDESNRYYSSKDGVLFNKDQTKLLLCPPVGRSEYTIPSTVKFFNSNAFSSYDNKRVLEKLFIPASVETIFISSTPSFIGKHAAFIVDENNENYSSQDGVLFNKDKTELICYPQYKTDKEYVVPDTVKKISSFAYTEYLSKLVISKNVESISAFANKIVEYVVDDLNANYSTQDGVLFNKNKTELISYPGCKEDLIYRIPDNVKFVAFSAFSYPKNIKSLIVPNELKDKDGYNIRLEFFKLCDVYFTGSESEWDDMNVTVSNTFSFGEPTYHFNYVEESEHNYGDWITIDESDCFSEKNGLQKRACSRCEYIEYETVPYQHDFSGNSQYCQKCGEENPDYVAPTPGGSTDPTPTPGGGSSGGSTGGSIGGGGGTPAPEVPAETPATPETPDTTPAPTSTKPATVKATGTKSKSKALAVYWNKLTGVDGYQIQVATDKKFKKNKKTVTVAKQNASKKTVKNLKKNKKYYVRVRSYKIVNGKKVYGKWSKVKSIKTK